MNEPQQEPTWTSLGVGTSARTFFEDIQDLLASERATAAAQAVFCVLTEVLPGGLVGEMLDQLPEDIRQYLSGCVRHPNRSDAAVHREKDELYEEIADHMNAEPEDARRILHAVFAALQFQITRDLAHRVLRTLPAAIAGTWESAARHRRLY